MRVLLPSKNAEKSRFHSMKSRRRCTPIRMDTLRYDLPSADSMRSVAPKRPAMRLPLGPWPASFHCECSIRSAWEQEHTAIMSF
eukprot:7387339-Prymnesium_polylepis.2